MLDTKKTQNKSPLASAWRLEINSRQRLQSIAIAMVEKANNKAALQNVKCVIQLFSVDYLGLRAKCDTLTNNFICLRALHE